ncbi:hypothetical protein ACLGL1_07765 [Peptococcus simiae]
MADVKVILQKEELEEKDKVLAYLHELDKKQKEQLRAFLDGIRFMSNTVA